VVVSVLLLAGSAIAVWKLVFGGNPGPSPSDWITVDLEATESVSWSVLLPVPIETNGSVWYLVPSLEATIGSGNWSVVDGPNGSSLQVSGTGPFRLHAGGPARGSPYAAVTPQNLTRTGGELKHEGLIPCLVYVDAGGSEAELRFSVSIGTYENHMTFITTLHAYVGDLRAGWQELWGLAGFQVDG